jgi:membrane-associated phospholipid phosphatase
LRAEQPGDGGAISTAVHHSTDARRGARPHEPLRDLLRTEAFVVIAGMAVAIAILSLIGALVRSVSTIDQWDLDVVREVADRRTGLGADLSNAGTYLAETVPVAALTALLTLAAWWRWRTWTHPLFVVAAVGGEKLIYLVSSIIVGRDRPSVDTLGDTYATNSFPSGHVASAVTLYGAAALLLGVVAGRNWRNVAFVVAAIFAAIVAVCRVYRGFHYPTDVAAGAALGVAWLWFVWWRLEPHILGDARPDDAIVRGVSQGDRAARHHTASVDAA